MDDFVNETDDSKNVIVEINKDVEDTLFDEDRVVTTNEDEIKISKPKKQKNKKKKFSFKDLTKKQKIIFIVIISLIVILIIFALVYIFIIKPNRNKNNDNDNVTPIVIEKDNYIYSNGILKFIDKDDKELGEYDCQNKEEDKCYVAYLSLENQTDLPKYVNQNEKEIERTSQIYSNNYVFVQDGQDIYLYDISKKEKINTFELIKTGDTTQNYVAVKDTNGKYGLLLIDGDVKKILDTKYDYVEIYNSNDSFIISEDNKFYIIDKEGKKISSAIAGTIKSFNSKYILSYNTSYQIYDYSAVKVSPDSYDYAELADDFIFTISSRKMTVYDKDFNKLNESPIKIKTSDYQKKYVFDDNNTLKETKKAFEYSLKNNILTITSDDKTKNINIYEAIVNTKYDYVNYSDGALYIYSDKEKTNLLGSYTCKNKNEVNSKDADYSKCFIAKEGNIIPKEENKGYIPIINGNYVYISDVKNDGESLIILYDLKNFKNVSEYSEVQTGVSSDNITASTIINGLIFSKNTSGGYGVITFGQNGPSGLIAFNETKRSDGLEPSGKTLSISYLKDYLLVKREKRNFLYDKLGNEIASTTFEITDYLNNYMVVKNNDKYLVYNMKGTILSDEGKYISLKENYFVLIDNDNKFNIYSYKDAKKAILNKNLELYETDYTKAYEINETDNNYIITIIKSGTKNNYLFDKVTGKLISSDGE